jgi:hypothetical protein
MRKYECPKLLNIEPSFYERWLSRKAIAHVKRDRKRWPNIGTINRKTYMEAIHAAVIKSNGKDAYTGEHLRWELLSTWSDEMAKGNGSKHKSNFAFLPTVDHVRPSSESPVEFKICAWRTNDAKSDMTYKDLIGFCRKVIRHSKKK